MKTYPVKFRPDAIADIEAIFFYVLDKSENFVTASSYTDRIFSRCESIGHAPFGGVARPDIASGIRMVPFEHSAVILYVVTDETVVITNVFAGGRDYEAILRRPG
jgi:toxin ParE1/3/4